MHPGEDTHPARLPKPGGGSLARGGDVKNDKRTIFGWAMYDWANSAYSTVIAGAILPSFFVAEVVGEGEKWNGWSGESLWGLITGGGAMLLFLAMPVLGAIADFSGSKLRFLRAFAYGGSLFTTMLFFAGTGDVLFTLGFFLLAQICFVGANVFYDGFLPDITTDDTIDRVSSRGFALGYVGGGIYLAIVFAAIQLAPDADAAALAASIGIGGTGLWWAGFSTFAFRRLRETGEAGTLPSDISVPRAAVALVAGLAAVLIAGLAGLVLGPATGVGFGWIAGPIAAAIALWVLAAYLTAQRLRGRPDAPQYRPSRRTAKLATIGFRRTWTTARKLLGFKQLMLFVVAYVLYNDGVQTTISISAVYGTETLRLETATIALTFLVVQFVAFGGALFFGWLSGRINIKRAIQINLIVWVAIALAAYQLPAESPMAFLGLGAVIGVVLGGVQALSRSLYGSMIPEEASAEFYGFYSVFSKFSAIFGPIIFSLVGRGTDSGRPAILSIIAFFALGLAVFSFVDIDEARRSRERWAFDEA